MSIVAHSGSDYTAFLDWLRRQVTTLVTTLLLVSLFYHTALGLQVVVEDYVHSGFKFAAILAVRLGCFVFATAGILATLRMVFAS